MSESKFRKLTTEEIRKRLIGSHRTNEVWTCLSNIEKLFGKVSYHFEKDFPSDGQKCSIYYGLALKENEDEFILSWDYKHWNYEGLDIDKDELFDFSVFATSENVFKSFLNEFPRNTRKDS